MVRADREPIAALILAGYGGYLLATFAAGVALPVAMNALTGYGGNGIALFYGAVATVIAAFVIAAPILTLAGLWHLATNAGTIPNDAIGALFFFSLPGTVTLVALVLGLAFFRKKG